jgi:hypothetical protein
MNPGGLQPLTMSLPKSPQATVTDTADVETTLYPKITTDIHQVVAILRGLNRDPEKPGPNVPLDPIPIIGTVKLHGTHADILVHSDNTITFQSRNLTDLSTTKDNQGFAAAMAPKTAVLLALRDLYLARWKELNPNSAPNESAPVIIAGEWIGTKIQRYVAIAQLSRRFVIVSVNINNAWQRDQDYSDISLPQHDIYNVSKVGVYHATLYPEDIKRTASEIQRLAEEVAAKCPFAASFGIEGEGEGVVWKLEPEAYNGDPRLWFKSKGGKFKPTFFRAPKKPNTPVKEKRKVAAERAAAWCSEQRMEQACDVMREKGMKGLGEWLEWIQNDVLIEEKGEIERGGMDEKELKIEIAKIGRVWYAGMLEGADV